MGSSIDTELGTVMFTDVVGYSALTEADEMGTLQLVKRDLDSIQAIAQKFGGKVCDRIGDGLFMYFRDATKAVECAIRIQEQMADNAQRRPPDQCLQHRIGIHLGDVVISSEKVLGDSVN